MRTLSLGLPALVLLASVACARGAEPLAGDPPLAPVEEAREAAGQEVARDFDHAHALWTEVLAAHVKGDDFDYGAVKKDPAKLNAYLGVLHAVTPAEMEGWTEDQRFAFWINAYNAHTIQKVVGSYPIKSIKKLSKAFGLKSVFDQEFVPMRAFHPEGKDDDLSLNDVEHGILRAQFADARLHAAINCASVSCPPLRAEAYVAARLDAQLEEQMRAFVLDETRNRLDRDANRLQLSEIFKWFEADFERDAGSVREYFLRFAPEADHAVLRKARIGYLDYDWGLNDAGAGS